jgi:4-amino-4-deoxy-L-arabinose transferase-like glycosyltransferase
MKRFINLTNIILLLVILLGLTLRLYKINSPIADWHSWRQADTAAVTRNFIKEGFNPFLPKYDDMSGVSEKPISNVNRYRFVEFPIYNIVTYPFYLFGGVNDTYSRLVSVLFSLGSILFIFLIAKKYTNRFTALLAAFLYAALPYNVFYSRTTLPEPTFVFFALGMVYFCDLLISSKGKLNLFLALLFSMTAFLIKPWAIFFVPPLIYAVLKNDRFSLKHLWFVLLSVIPFILWRLWILQHPEGIPASNWLYNGNGIRFQPSFWWWIISERLGKEILGVTGLVLFIIGLLIKPKRNYFLHIWALSLLTYFLIFATGNVNHDYYQYIFMPVATIMLARGFNFLITGVESFIPRFWTIILALLFLPLTFYFTWIPIKELYKVNNPSIVEAGLKADQILPKEAIVIAPYNGDTAFLYQTNRSGFAFNPLPTIEMVSQYGVTSYVSTSKDDKTNWIMRHFQVLENNSKFVIVDLTKPVSEFRKDDPEP